MKKHITKCSACHATPGSHPERDFIKDSEAAVTLCSECIQFFSVAREEISKTREANDQQPAPQVDIKTSLPVPEEIFNYLNDYVIGQDSAKRTLAIAVAHHYRRLRDPSIGKSNILLIGPTGTGKTELGRTISKYLKVPFVTADATGFTSKGYAGEDVDSVIVRLLVNCNWNVEEAEQGIVFIDEIDKLSRRNNYEGNIGTVAVQQGLLRLMEGDDVKINRPDPNSPTGLSTVYINTSKILFICAGAFVGLDELVKKSTKKPLGLGGAGTATEAETFWAEKIEAKHLVQYGMIPEFLGRVPIVAVTTALHKHDLVKILKEPKNSIVSQYQNLFKQDHVELIFTEEFYEHIVDEAIKKELGARGLRQILETRLQNLFFRVKELKNKKVTLLKNTETVADKPEPVIRRPKKKLTPSKKITKNHP